MGNELYSEKVSVNMNSSTLSTIDLLVDNGYYSNRSDFINQAVREALRQHQTTVDRIVEKKEGAAGRGNHWFIGVSAVGPRELEEWRGAGGKRSIEGYGVLIIDKDCPEETLFSVVEEIRVRGKVRCTDSARAHYGLK